MQNTTSQDQQKKIKIFTLSDHPHSPSGVGTQTKYFIMEMLKTGLFQFISMGGAIKHENYQPMKMEEFGDDWIIYPIDGYGNPEAVRSMLRIHKPDMIWFMTDPRFFGWLWEMENEIRPLVPMVYYHVWDNYPYPTFNEIAYKSTDVIVTISKLTSDLVKTVSPESEEHYLPHAVPLEIFQKISDLSRSSFRKQHLGSDDDDFIVFWNNRNARRKQSGSLIFWWKEFVEKLEKKHKGAKATLLMHTDHNDPNGQDLHAIIDALGLDDKVKISSDKVPLDVLASIYGSVDATINISDAEGFGLATFESMACETPIIVTMTGGLQEQVTNLESLSHDKIVKRNAKLQGKLIEYEHGIGLEPASKALIGSQEVPYIYEDRVNKDQVVNALMTMYEYGREKRLELGKAGREHVEHNYNFEKNMEKWKNILLETYEKHGSWETRKNYKSWEIRKI